jgi:hypothetical protein
MRFVITFMVDAEAFDVERLDAIIDALRELADRLEEGDDQAMSDGVLRDRNGAQIGTIKLEKERP